MSFRRSYTRPRSDDVQKLAERLQAEVEHPSPDENAQPIIVAEPPSPAPISRLFVIWDEWGSLSLQDRSEIIMTAYQAAKGDTDALAVSVAMGLTPQEAQRLGIS